MSCTNTLNKKKIKQIKSFMKGGILLSLAWKLRLNNGNTNQKFYGQASLVNFNRSSSSSSFHISQKHLILVKGNKYAMQHRHLTLVWMLMKITHKTDMVSENIIRVYLIRL